jgi:hypothetical protein
MRDAVNLLQRLWEDMEATVNVLIGVTRSAVA